MGKKIVTFSLDDGIKQDIRVMEILNKYGLKGTFNINTGIATEASKWVYKGADVMRINATDIRDLYNGHEIAVHTLTHCDLTKQNKNTIYNEIYRDKCNIEDWFGVNVVGMAYPYGTYNDLVVEVAKRCGIKYARTVENTFSFSAQYDLLRFRPTCHFNDMKIKEIIENFLNEESDEQKLLYLWGHSYELDGDYAWGIFEEMCKTLSLYSNVEFMTNETAFLSLGILK